MTPAPSTPGHRTLLFGLGAVALIAVASHNDFWAFTHLSRQGIYDTGWGRVLKSVGYLPVWLLIGFAMLRSATTLPGRRHAVLLMVSPTLSGALGEILKLLIRRERPGPNAGAYVFRSFSDRPFSTSGFGMPSGDVIVAFAACAILARLWPRARVIWYGLAAACAVARVASRAHFLSDVTVAGIAGWGVADGLWQRFAQPRVPEASSPLS